jgi:hypothetical protein
MAAAPLNPTVSETAAAAARWRRVVSDANHRFTLSFDVLLVRIPFVDGPAHAGASHVHRHLGAPSSSPDGAVPAFIAHGSRQTLLVPGVPLTPTACTPLPRPWSPAGQAIAEKAWQTGTRRTSRREARSAAFAQEAEEVVAVAALGELFGSAVEAVVVQPAVAPGDLLDAADLEPLPILDHRDELRGLPQ